MASNLKELERLKDAGNNAFKHAQYRDACCLYGKAIESLITAEDEYDDKIHQLKLSLFLNLAACNLKLGGFEEARQCSNTALMFYNNPNLKLNQMGSEESDDITTDLMPILPILPRFQSFLSKALYRRTHANIELGNIKAAEIDIQLYNSIVTPKDHISIDSFKSTGEKRLTVIPKTDSDKKIQKSKSSDTATMTTNGGPCLQRNGLFSQTVTDVKVFIPLDCLMSEATITVVTSKQIRVEFNKQQLSVFHCKDNILEIGLRHSIVPAESTWSIEQFLVNSETPRKVLVLYLLKKTPDEWFPGCEWWESVFPLDEAIDTMTCTVDTNIGDLPPQARDRAYREHARFTDLTSTERENELNQLATMKKKFLESELKTREEAKIENEAMEENPERVQVNDLRSEFPHIQFTFK